MAVRQIKYTVYADRLEPSVKQFGGMQGDHKATEVLFEISSSLYEILKEQAESTNGRLIYRFDGYDGAGGVHSSDTKELPAEDGEELLVKLKYPLEEWITRYGGQIKVVLVISLLKDDSTEMELYNYPAVCQLKNRPFGTPAPGENHESISTLAQGAKESAEIAVRAKDEAIAAQIKAEENAEEVSGRIEPLEADVEGLKQSSVTKDYVDNAIAGLEDDVAYLSTHAATKQYVDDAVASSGVLKEYVDNEIANITDRIDGADEDIAGLVVKTGELETKTKYLPELTNDVLNLSQDIQNINQNYATKEYVDHEVEHIPQIETDIDTLKDDLEVIEVNYATKKYVDDAVASGGVSQEYVDNAIGTLEDDVAYLSTHAATKQYVDDAVASVSGGVSQEYVDNAIAGVKDIAENNESDIEVIRQQTGTLQNKVQGLEDDVDALKQSSVTIGYVQETYATKNEMASLEDDIGYIHEHYATKQYVDDAVASSGGGTGGGVSSWNDLTDKPFYDEGTKTATLDYANPPAVSIDFNGVFLGKVTDDLLTSDHLNGAKVSLSFTANGTVNNASQELNVDTLQVYPFPIGTAYQFECEADGTTFLVMIAVATQTGEVDFGGMIFNIPETGTYMGCVPYSEATQNSISLEYELIKTLEAKYLEIVNTTADTSVLAEQELSFTDDGNGMYQAMLGAIPLTAGKEYKVLWDGTEYVYKAINMDGMIMLGDFVAGNPFVIGVVDGSAMIATSNTSATHTISITEVGGCEIKQEYLPASLYTEIDQRIENYINEALGGEY